jgi:hypothetical protein
MQIKSKLDKANGCMNKYNHLVTIPISIAAILCSILIPKCHDNKIYEINKSFIPIYEIQNRQWITIKPSNESQKIISAKICFNDKLANTVIDINVPNEAFVLAIDKELVKLVKDNKCNDFEIPTLLNVKYISNGTKYENQSECVVHINGYISKDANDEYFNPSIVSINYVKKISDKWDNKYNFGYLIKCKGNYP